MSSIPDKRTMRGILYYGPNKLKFSLNIPMPTIKHPDEVLVKVSYCGICGTDLLAYRKPTDFFSKITAEDGHPLSGKSLPQVMGHEFSGIIVELGENLKKSGEFQVSDRVAVEPTCYCPDKPRWPGSKISRAQKSAPQKQSSEHQEDSAFCDPCKDGLTNICEDLGIIGLGCEDGGLAEYVVTSKHHLVKVPDWIPLDVAALVQPLAVSYHAFRAGDFKKGSSCLIVGCGPVGIGCILAAHAFEAGVVVCSEPATVRRDQARNLGANGVLNPRDYGDDNERVCAALRAMSPSGHGFDYVLDCSGFPVTFYTGLNCLKPRGKLVNLAIWPQKPMDFYPMDFTSAEKSITGSMCYTIGDFQGVIGAMADGRISLDKCRDLITKKVMLEDAIEGGFDELLRNKDHHVKILITPKILKNGKEVEPVD